jgi:hypothetical protein
MKRAIWKFPIPSCTEFTGEVPEGHFEVLTVQMQGAQPCMWAIVNPTQRKILRKFRIVATGEEFEKTEWLVYLGTFQPGDGLVFHLFEQR